MAMLPRRSLAGAFGVYANAAIDWKQFAGQTITLAGAIHPWSNAITPLLPDFTKLTGIDVVTDFQLEAATFPKMLNNWLLPSADKSTPSRRTADRACPTATQRHGRPARSMRRRKEFAVQMSPALFPALPV
jgi:hypothetical protein